MNSLSKSKRVLIIKTLVEEPRWFIGTSDKNIIDLLDSIFELRSLPSEDTRYQNAYDDAVQHLYRNEDWDLEYTFLTRFDASESTVFTLFLESLVKSDFHSSEDSRFELIESINDQLNPEGYTLETTDFDEMDRPVMSISKFDPNNNYPAGVIKNDIPFYTLYKSEDYTLIESKSAILIIDFSPFSYWNDYYLQSRFNLIYRDSNKLDYLIGELKIITNNQSNYTSKTDDDGNNILYKTIIPTEFRELNDSFCSLGQDKNYYHRLKEIFKSKFRSILFALRDAAFFTDISDLFENDSNYESSLIRTNTSERLIREIRHELSGKKRSDLYEFNYLFSPRFQDSDNPPISINFNFETNSEIPNRIWAIIGKNGVGKTQFISSLPKHLIEEKVDYFEGSIPLFSKIIALSYSPFDTFKPSKSGVNINYIFCSLRDDAGDFGDDRGRAIKFGRARSRIQDTARERVWYDILSKFLPQSFMDKVFDTKKSIPPGIGIAVDTLNSERKKLSSGQRILLETITNIVAHIRYDSLLLFDEPETHLHPNAIAQLMNTIYELVKEFESFCILTTHSPIIIRELLSRNVYVFDRFDDNLEVRKIGLESFGANLTDITEEVFGTNEIPKHYQDIIKRLIKEGKTTDEIVKAIQSDNVPLSLNLRVLIRNLTEN